MLTSPTVAVDAQRVVLIMPVGAILTVTSDTSFEKRMIEVSWGGRKLAMFGSDLTERGEENFQAEAVAQAPVLWTRKRFGNYCKRTSTRPSSAELRPPSDLPKVMDDIPSGIPHPDGTDRIRFASSEYKASREETTAAMKRLSDYLIRGMIPPDLERKPVAKESAEPEKGFSKGRS
jgi:hypothetical protein